MKNVLLLCGGGSTEHEVSLVSVKYIKECLESLPNVQLTTIEIDKKGSWIDSNGKKYLLDQSGVLKPLDQSSAGFKVDYAVPCIHGYPGETGDIQSYFEMIGVPYLGCNSETSKMCFNKITTKLWATALGVKNTPYIFLSDNTAAGLYQVKEFQKQNGDMVVKASNQGSSVGCYLVKKDEDPAETLKKAFTYSPYVLVEKRMYPREIEVSVYEYQGKLQVSRPGEIICPSNFYSYEEKYSQGSQTTTETVAQNLTSEQIKTITDYASRLYYGLRLRHLSRVDFFLENGEIYLNEINTFPGLTPISMFPKMLEANGHSFKAFLQEHIGK